MRNLLVLALFFMGLLVGTVQAEDGVFKNQTIRIVIGTKPGGSFDLYAQLTAAHIGKFLPGAPNVIVEHRPGSGGSKAAGYVYAAAPKDGTVLAILPQTIAAAQRMFPERSKWDVSQMRYIGRYAAVNAVFAVRKGAPATTLDRLMTTELAVGCTSNSSQSCQTPSAFAKLAGAQFKMVKGYAGSSAFVSALSKGEVDLVSLAWNTWRSRHKEAIDAGTYIPLLQSGLTRQSELPDLPLMQEVVADPHIKEVLSWISASAEVGRALMAPPGIDPDRLTLLKTAFAEMMQDPDFIADANTRKALLAYQTGEAVDALTQTILNTDPAIVATALSAFE